MFAGYVREIDGRLNGRSRRSKSPVETHTRWTRDAEQRAGRYEAGIPHSRGTGELKARSD